MSNWIRFLVLIVVLALLPLGLGCTPQPMGDDDDNDDNDSAGDDDAGDDDAGDDDGGDDDGGDDDDSTPTYTGEIDMNGASLDASCTVTVPASDPGGGEGYFDHFIDMSGWAGACWTEMWDHLSPYCEGWNPYTGEVCETKGYDRPGWDMNNADFGWNSANGFWDQWDQHLLYHVTWPPASNKSIFICENAGSGFDTYFCCCDYATNNCYCTEFNSW